MRLMFLSASGQLGGAETSLLEILASLRRAEPSWLLQLLVAGEGPLEARAAALGVGTILLPFDRTVARLGESGAASGGGWLGFAAQSVRAGPGVAAYLGRMRGAIRDANPDILHTNGIKMHLLGARAIDRPRGARAIARPQGAQARLRPNVVWHLHDYLGSRPLSARLLRWNRARCAAVIANSASVAADARRVLGGALTVAVVYNGIDLDRFAPSGERLDLDALAGAAPPAPGTIRVGLLGTFARWKGHETFLRAIARVPPGVPIRAYIIGDAVYDTGGSQYTRQELVDVARRLGIGDRVVFTGFVSKPEAALRALDIVVHASTAPEPFGLVIAEAMACERPVIVSLAGGVRELVTDGVDAVAHAPGDVEALAARITELAMDGERRARIALAGRATAERSFGRARLAAELIPIYRGVAGRGV